MSAKTTAAESTATATISTMTAPAATKKGSSPKGFQVTHTSYQRGSTPFRSASPPIAPAAFSGPRNGGSSGSPVQPPQPPPSFYGVTAPSPYQRHRSSSSSSAHSATTTNTPPLGPRTTAVPLITPRYQKKSRTARHMSVTDSFPTQQTPSGALQQEATERMTIQNGPMQYDQEMHFHTYDVYRHGKRQIHTRSVGYSSDGDLVMMREDYSEPSDVDNGFVLKRTEISDPAVLDPRARRPLTDKELHSKKKIHLNRPRYKKYPGIRAPKNRKVRNRLLNDFFAHELAREVLVKAQKWRTLNPDEPETSVGPSFADLPKAVMHAFDLEGEEQLLEFERLRVHPDMLGPQLRNVRAPPDPDSPEGRFQGLNTRLRGELQHALNSEFLTQQIEDLEVHFSAFIKDGSKSPESLVFHFRDGYGRLICHGVAAYYQLVSESRTVMDGSGTKLTYVSLPKTRRQGVRAVNPPHVPLMLVLKRNRRNLPAKHSLSAQTTPQIAPTPDMVASPPALGLEGDSTSKEAGVDDAEVMSPLDLNAPAMPNVRAQPTSHSGLVGRGKATNGHATGAQRIDSGGKNPTVFRTVHLKLPTADPLPFYIPMLRLTLSVEQQEDAVEQLEAASAGVSPDLGPFTPPLTATQRKKLRKAERVRSADASQDDYSTRR
ncbi:R3H-associated N-terminal domain family protein [Leishmania donovani]|uniref:R3H-associated N-terminal domain family protein n=2 Tax=Leishmania donovani TaxID=5661 RepID=A0A504XN29_LEIDO|nr:R3H-associated N-terminal domain family protein [Leishmania donovani]